jgi:hypothetical protein
MTKRSDLPNERNLTSARYVVDNFLGLMLQSATMTGCHWLKPIGPRPETVFAMHGEQCSAQLPS